MPTRPVSPVAEVVESLARPKPEVAVDLIDSGTFDEALLATAGQESPSSARFMRGSNLSRMTNG
jgi:hypothetical protein